MRKIWVISDTHTQHGQLTIPEGIDMVIHAGDASNSREVSFNDAEMRDFVHWFSALPIKYKVFSGGNHDTSIEAKMWTKEMFEEYGIYFLNDETIEIEGTKIFGSPYSTTFGHGWAFNCSRNKIDQHWQLIEENTDIVITHSPCQGMLDYTRSGENAGCGSLLYRVGQIKPQYHICGHIHEEGGRQLIDQQYPDTTFINGSVISLRSTVVNNGQIIEL